MEFEALSHPPALLANNCKCVKAEGSSEWESARRIVYNFLEVFWLFPIEHFSPHLSVQGSLK
jgi:hypothetical protein